MRSARLALSAAAAISMLGVAGGAAAVDPGNMRQKTRGASRTVQPTGGWSYPKTKWSVATDRRRAAKRRNQQRNRRAHRS